MFVIIGLLVVFGSVIGGFMLEGGKILILLQVVEFMIIGGAAIGALLISTPKSLLVKIIQKALGSLKSPVVNKQYYLDLLKLLFELFQIIRRDGLISLESHVERPRESTVFTKFPKIAGNHYVMIFITDTLRLLIMGGVSPHEIEMLVDSDLDLHHQEGTKPGMILQKIGDSMPGLGIVAAVLGIIITMQAISGPPEEIGHKVAVALVGTFLGILISYGFVQPLATNIDLANDEEARILEVIKAGIITAAKAFNPIISVEFARRAIPEYVRPTFEEMEKYVKEIKSV